MAPREHDVEDAYPLSPLQRGVLFHAVLDPEAGDYVVQLSAELAPQITPGVFRRSWQVMIARHDVLRTFFVTDAVPQGPLQVVVRHAELPWTELDWRGTAVEERQHRLRVMLATDRRRGFVLTDPPLLRITAIRFADVQWWVVLSFHHILWDGWSLSQLLQEVGWCCEALSNGRAPDLVHRRPYRDYIEWLGGRDVRQAEAFWRSELAGLDAMASLGVDRVAQDRARSSYGQLTTRLSIPAHEALVDFARRSKLTLNTAVQGAWAILLARYTSTPDVVFGATVSGRPPDLAGADQMFGLFLNTLPVRVNVDEDAVLEDWLGALQAHQFGARDHDFCQLAEIQRSASRQGVPLFETILDFKNFPFRKDQRKTDWQLFKGEVATFEQSGYPLTITVSLRNELVIDADFSHARFDPSTVSRILGHLRTLLQEMPRRGNHRLCELEFLTIAETQQMEAWSTRSITTIRTRSFQEDFEARVAAAPDLIALITDREQVSYRALNRRANQLSRHLRDLGVGHEARVGICVERSPALVTAIIATFKAGAVYVPLDPAYPTERLARCARDARIDVLIVTARTVSAAPSILAQIVNLDDDGDAISARPDSDLVPASTGSAWPRLCHLHVRLDWRAEGRHGRDARDAELSRRHD